AFWEAGLVPKVHTHASKDAFGTLLFDRAFFVLKAHGDIDEPDTIVLSTKSYRELIHANPAFNAIMSAILLNFSILFVGYSLNDPDFRLLIERQITDFKGTTPIRYALMDGVGAVEAQILQRNAGIQVIDYPKGQHGEVLTFFQQLQQKVQQAEAKKPLQPISLPQLTVPSAAASAEPVAQQAPALKRSRKPVTAGEAAGLRGPHSQKEILAAAIPRWNLASLFSPTLRLRLTGMTIEATFEQVPALKALSAAAKGALLLAGGPGILAGLGALAPSSAVVSTVAIAGWSALADVVGKAIGDSSREAIGAAGAELRTCFSKEMLLELEKPGTERLMIVAEPPLETVPWE